MIVSLDTQYAGSRRMEDSVKKTVFHTRDLCLRVAWHKLVNAQ